MRSLAMTLAILLPLAANADLNERFNADSAAYQKAKAARANFENYNRGYSVALATIKNINRKQSIVRAQIVDVEVGHSCYSPLTDPDGRYATTNPGYALVAERSDGIICKQTFAVLCGHVQILMHTPTAVCSNGELGNAK